MILSLLIIYNDTIIMTVRSLFEHCGELWAPVDYVAANKFEPIQKQAVSNQAF